MASSAPAGTMAATLAAASAYGTGPVPVLTALPCSSFIASSYRRPKLVERELRCLLRVGGPRDQPVPRVHHPRPHNPGLHDRGVAQPRGGRGVEVGGRVLRDGKRGWV